MIASVKPVAPSFESMLPMLKARFRKACSVIPTWHDQEDAIQEMLGIAFALYTSLVRRGKTDKIFPSPLAAYSIKAYHAGRKLSGMSATDVTSTRCQILNRAVVHGLEYYDEIENKMVEVCVYDKYHRPVTIATFRIDYNNWIKTLNDRNRKILFAIIDGDTTSELATRFCISPGRISQIRRELFDSWHDFVSDHHEEKEMK